MLIFFSGIISKNFFISLKLKLLHFVFPQPVAAPFPYIRSTKSLVAKHLTPEKWEKLSTIKTKTSGFTLAQAIACAVEFDNQVKS